MSHDDVKEKLDAKLIRMGNQIATFFSSQDQSTAAADVADHINKFWEPRMRRDLFIIAENSTDGFHELFVQALPMVNRPDNTKSK